MICLPVALANSYMLRISEYVMPPITNTMSRPPEQEAFPLLLFDDLGLRASSCTSS